MKKYRIIILVTLIIMFVPSIASAQKKNDGFQTFFTKFRSAVTKNNKSAIKNMMASSFEWALDGYVSRNEAFKLMSQIGGKEDRLWKGLRQAVAKKPVVCKGNYCNNRSGYHVWSGGKYGVEIMFENIDGNWKWSALLGD